MILESPTGVLGGSRGEQVGLAVLLFRIWLVGLHLFAVSVREAKDFQNFTTEPLPAQAADLSVTYPQSWNPGVSRTLFTFFK